MNKYDKLQFIDRNGRVSNLYVIGNGDNLNLSIFELPTIGPDCVSDVRFASQTFLETYLGDQEKIKNYIINLIVNDYPVTISWNISSYLKSFSLSYKLNNQKLLSGVYYYKLESELISITKRLIFLK